MNARSTISVVSMAKTALRAIRQPGDTTVKRTQRPAYSGHVVVPGPFLTEWVSQINAVNHAVVKIASPVKNAVVVTRGDRKEVGCHPVIGQASAFFSDRAPYDLFRTRSVLVRAGVDVEVARPPR